MLSAVAASSGWTTAGSASSRRRSRVSSAKPNSPPWLTTTPVRTDLNQLLVTGFDATATTDGLQDRHAQNDRAHQRQVAQQQRHVEQHAERDEEHAEQHLAVRADGRLDLMAELGLCEPHAGEEGPEGERQSRGLRRPGRGEHREQHGEREQFSRERTPAMRTNSGRSSQRPVASTSSTAAAAMAMAASDVRRRRAGPAPPRAARAGRETRESSGPGTGRSPPRAGRACGCSPIAR